MASGHKPWQLFRFLKVQPVTDVIHREEGRQLTSSPVGQGDVCKQFWKRWLFAHWIQSQLHVFLLLVPFLLLSPHRGSALLRSLVSGEHRRISGRPGAGAADQLMRISPEQSALFPFPGGIQCITSVMRSTSTAPKLGMSPAKMTAPGPHLSQEAKARMCCGWSQFPGPFIS